MFLDIHVLRQGYAVSPTLFPLYVNDIDKVLQHAVFGDVMVTDKKV